jgi:hypothetical protein
MATHEANSVLCHRVDALLAPYGARRLSTGELRKLPAKLGAVRGWRIATDLDFKGESVVVNVLFGRADFEEPAFVTVSRPEIKPCEIPHLEDHGKLCVWRSRYTPGVRIVVA